jgi:hypothetical protein
MLIVMCLLSRCYPFRMMLLYPCMIVLNPPVTIVPLVMLVVGAHSRRRRVSICRWPGVSVCRRRRISVRRRLRVVRMSAIEASLKRHRSEHENQCLQERRNFVPHCCVPRRKEGASTMPAKKGRESRGFANRARAGNPNFPGAIRKDARRKKTQAGAQKIGHSAVLQAGQLFVV